MAIARIHSIISVSRTEIELLIREYCFCSKQRAILASRWIDGLTFDEIALKHDISVRQAKNIIRKYREIVLTHIDELKLH